MLKAFFHRISHLLGNNLVRGGVFGIYPNMWLGVKCEGCGLVRLVEGKDYFKISKEEEDAPDYFS